MRKGINNRYNKKGCKKVIRPFKIKKVKRVRAYIATGCCGMDMLNMDDDS